MECIDQGCNPPLLFSCCPVLDSIQLIHLNLHSCCCSQCRNSRWGSETTTRKTKAFLISLQGIERGGWNSYQESQHTGTWRQGHRAASHWCGLSPAEWSMLHDIHSSAPQALTHILLRICVTCSSSVKHKNCISTESASITKPDTTL